MILVGKKGFDAEEGGRSIDVEVDFNVCIP